MLKKIKGIVKSFNGYTNETEIEIVITKCDDFDLTKLAGKDVEIIVK